VRVKELFPWLSSHRNEPSSNNDEIDETIVGKTLSLDLFKTELAGLGYDFEVFADRDGKVFRFRRIAADNSMHDGDVW
jgi:hypothetical protein